MRSMPHTAFFVLSFDNLPPCQLNPQFLYVMLLQRFCIERDSDKNMLGFSFHYWNTLLYFLLIRPINDLKVLGRHNIKQRQKYKTNIKKVFIIYQSLENIKHLAGKCFESCKKRDDFASTMLPLNTFLESFGVEFSKTENKVRNIPLNVLKTL